MAMGEAALHWPKSALLTSSTLWNLVLYVNTVANNPLKNPFLERQLIFFSPPSCVRVGRGGKGKWRMSAVGGVNLPSN